MHGKNKEITVTSFITKCKLAYPQNKKWKMYVTCDMQYHNSQQGT